MANPAGIALSVGGSLLGSFNDKLLGDKRDKIMKLILERRQRQQDEMDAMLMDEIGTIRGETPEAEREQALGEFTSQLREARAATPQSYGARGAVSDREASALQELAPQLGEFAGREADITSRIDAPMRMRHEQGLRKGRLGTGLREKGNLMESADFLDELRLARVRKNPWLGVLSSAMKGAGSAMSMGVGGGGKLTMPKFEFDVDPRTLPIGVS